MQPNSMQAFKTMAKVLWNAFNLYGFFAWLAWLAGVIVSIVIAFMKWVGLQDASLVIQVMVLLIK